MNKNSSPIEFFSGTTSAMLKQLAGKLSRRNELGNFSALVGFDGFVDTIKKPIHSRKGAQRLYFKTINEFGNHLQTLSGKSGQVELSTLLTKLGGNAPIFSNSLGAKGVASYCIGSFGLPVRHEVFNAMHPLCNTIPVNNPGQSQAIEFDDGKIILSDLEVFEHFDWGAIKRIAQKDQLINYARKSQFIALLDWVNLPHANDIWKGFLDDILREGTIDSKYFLFDLCDPSKKSAIEIEEVLKVISNFSQHGHVTLGLNENETRKLWLALNGYDHSDGTSVSKFPPLQEAGKFIFKQMQIQTLLIHPRDRSLAVEKDGILELSGHVVKEPALLTGGGDNLNAGYALGRLLDMNTKECLLLGMASSGSYVLNGHSASLDELHAYIAMWAASLEA